MNATQIEEAEKQLAEIKAKSPDWTDPFWKDQMLPFLTLRLNTILAKLTVAKPEEVAIIQGMAQALTSLINEPVKQAEYEKRVSDEIAKWKPKEETDGNGKRVAGWAANAGRRLARR